MLHVFKVKVSCISDVTVVDFRTLPLYFLIHDSNTHKKRINFCGLIFISFSTIWKTRHVFISIKWQEQQRRRRCRKEKRNYRDGTPLFTIHFGSMRREYIFFGRNFSTRYVSVVYFCRHWIRFRFVSLHFDMTICMLGWWCVCVNALTTTIFLWICIFCGEVLFLVCSKDPKVKLCCWRGAYSLSARVCDFKLMRLLILLHFETFFPFYFLI